MSWLQEQIREREDYRDEDVYKQKKSWRSIVCTDTTKGWIFIAIFAIVLPVLVYFVVTNTADEKSNNEYFCLVEQTFRVPCGKTNIHLEECNNILCCFDTKTKECYHSLPSRYYYEFKNKSNSYEAAHQLSPFNTKSVNALQLYVNEKTEDIVSIILKENSEQTQVEDNVISNKNYDIKIFKDRLMVEIFRNDTKSVLLSTTRGPLIASDKYWEWTVYLGGSALFGLNQTFINVTENVNFTKVIYKNRNDHYTLPIIWSYNNGSFHGVKFIHDGPLEIKILPSHLIILRSLSGQRFEIELALGPTPALLHDQQASLFLIPPPWVMETHMCRKSGTLDVDRIIKQFSPVDSSRSFCIDDNLFMAIMKDNLTNPNILSNFSSLYDIQDKKFILSLPPQILVNTSLHDLAEQNDILYKYNLTSYKGQYLNEEVVYPDYNHTNIQSFIEDLHNLLSEYLNLTIDGLILNDNWPIDNSFRMNGSHFPYFPLEFENAMSYTLPWNLSVPSSPSAEHITNHNSYGSWQLKAIESFYSTSDLDIKPFIISAANSFEQSEPVLIQNVDASWENLNMHIQNILFNSMVGNHLVSLPVCGDNQNYNASIQETLCIRWYLAAATMPMLRVSSSSTFREPSNLYSKFAQQNANWALEFRQMLLPIYQTILSKNQPVVRPMFYEFYDDNTTFSLKQQYMIGENILIAHPFTSGVNQLQIYLPRRINIWYELWAGQMYNSTSNPWVDINVRENDMIVFIAQGTIVPFKVDNVLNLVVGLDCSVTPCTATTTLLLESYINFSANDTSVTISNITNSDCSYTIGYIKLNKYNVTGYDEVYEKNVAICNGTDTVIINYKD